MFEQPQGVLKRRVQRVLLCHQLRQVLLALHLVLLPSDSGRRRVTCRGISLGRGTQKNVRISEVGKETSGVQVAPGGGWKENRGAEGYSVSCANGGSSFLPVNIRRVPLRITRRSAVPAPRSLRWLQRRTRRAGSGRLLSRAKPAEGGRSYGVGAVRGAECLPAPSGEQGASFRLRSISCRRLSRHEKIKSKMASQEAKAIKK